MAEYTEVSSSRSTEEVYESRWRKGLDGWDKTDAICLILEDSSCSKDISEFPKYLKPEIADRIGKYFKDGVFEFDFSREKLIGVEGNTVYHTIPHYAGEGSESVLDKLRRIMAGNLEEME